LLKPTIFILNGKRYYLTEVMDIISNELEAKFFEFIINKPDAYSPDRILVFAEPPKSDGLRPWHWFIYLKGEDRRIVFSYHYRDLVTPEKDFFIFANYVRKVTPEALPYILFNYIV
jgi:hypothetical protein